MTYLSPHVQMIVAALVLVAGAYDILYRRIPNWLVLSGLVAGIAINGILGGGGGLLQSALGFGLAVAIYLPLYLLRGMGAGDLKLMAALGSIVGPVNWLAIFIISGILGGVLAVVLMLARGRLRKTLWNTGYIVWEIVHFRKPYLSSEELDVRSVKAMRLPHGAVVALGSLAFLSLGVLLAR